MEYNRELDKKPPLPNNIYNKLMEHGFITGSKVFGGWDAQKSDIDLCLPPVKELLFDNIFDLGWYDAGYSNHTEFRNAYFKLSDGNVLNVLFFYNRNDWLEWRVVTNQFIRMIQVSNKLRTAVLVKKARTEFFESLRQVFYGYRYK